MVKGLDFFAIGIGLVCATTEGGAVVVETVMTMEVAAMVLCAKMLLVVGSQMNFTISWTKGYMVLVKRRGESGMEGKWGTYFSRIRWVVKFLSHNKYR